MFNKRMRVFLIYIAVLFVSSCSSEHERPAHELNIPRGELTVAEIAEISVEVGARHGLSADVKNPDQMQYLNMDMPAVFIFLNNGAKTAVTITTLMLNDSIQVWFYSSGLPAKEDIVAIEQDLQESFIRLKHNKLLIHFSVKPPPLG